jgi:D-glycero-D-manno-heptose 1,7-bisphosphate phosphatase
VSAGIPCIFFDRDGIVNRAPDPDPYVLRDEDFHLLPEFFEALRIARERGYAAAVVTNQRCVSLGLLSRADLERMHDRLLAECGRRGLALLEVAYCPHGGDHPDRKPAPGMLRKAAARHGIDLARSWMVGDSPRDAEAGRRAGCRTLYVGGAAPCPADVCIASVTDLPDALRKHL